MALEDIVSRRLGAPYRSQLKKWNGVKLLVVGYPLRLGTHFILTGFRQSDLTPKSALGFHTGAITSIV